MATTKAPEASDDFRMLADAARIPPNPDLIWLKQTRSVCGLHPTKAGEEPAGPVKYRSAQCQAQDIHDLVFLDGLVKVPNFEGLLRNQGRNFRPLPDHLVELLAKGRNVSLIFEDGKVLPPCWSSG